VTANRASTQTISSLTGWTQIYAQTTQKSIEVWARIADGGANDAPTVAWSGSSRAVAWIDSFYGDVQTTLGSLLHASNVVAVSGGTAPPTPTLTSASESFTANDCLLYFVGAKATTATGDASAVLAPAGTTLTGSYIDNSVSGLIVGAAYVQQTTQADWNGADFSLTQATPESLSAAGVALALASVAAAVKYLKILAHSNAASDTGITGHVFSADESSYIGKFTGAAFEASLESGDAVLKVAVTEFGGSSLTTSDTPKAFIYSSTDASIGPADCTVIEE
jgi:hypothetical protein